MYQPSTPCGAKEARCSVVSWTSTRVPGEERGVWLKLKLPKVAAYAERLGWWREERRRFKLMSHCGNNMYHYWIWAFGSSVAIPARIWCFYVWIERSVAFWRCTCGRKSWKVTWYFWKLCGVLHYIQCRGCEVQGRGHWSGAWEKMFPNWPWVLLHGESWLGLRGLS